ncbi:MAG: hypothetical protein ACERKV_10190 [Clostridiaceae bacterium]
MTKRVKFAKFIRIITVPPILVLSLFIILFFLKDNIFKNISEFFLSILFLMLIPVLAYPLASIIPKYKDRGRDGQRSLAFILSLVGYAAAIIYGLISHSSNSLMLIYMTYFLSIVILTVFNKVIKLRASGHACSITGPLILLIYLIGWKSVLPCVIIFALIIWSSLLLKRHTLKEIVTGSLSAMISFAIILLLFSI